MAVKTVDLGLVQGPPGPAAAVATTTVPGTVKSGSDIRVAVDGAVTIDTTFTTSAAEFPIIEANKPVKESFGKLKKFQEDWNAFKTGIITIGKLVNNGLCTEAGFAADARQLNPNIEGTLAAIVAKQNSDLGNLKSLINSAIVYEAGDHIALQCASGNIRYRLQLGKSGYVTVYKSTDGGLTWPSSRAISDAF